MKLSQLRIFKTVARRSSVTSAADELHMSQPAVSLQLKHLEEEYGAKFYESNNQGVTLTPRGRDFLDAILPILDQIDNLENDFKIHSGRRKKSRALVVGGNYTLSATDLTDALMDFRENFPEIRLELETADNTTIEKYVRNARVDVALVFDPSYFSNCIYEPYRDWQAVAFVHAGSELSGKSISLRDLAAHPLVVKRGSKYPEELKRRGLSLEIALQCDTADTLKAAVRRGLGVGLLFRGAARIEGELRDGDFVPIDVPEMKDVTARAFIAYRAGGLSAQTMSFIEALRRIRSSSLPMRSNKQPAVQDC